MERSKIAGVVHGSLGRCDECTASISSIELKFRFIKERVHLCINCWDELVEQVELPLEKVRNRRGLNSQS